MEISNSFCSSKSSWIYFFIAFLLFYEQLFPYCKFCALLVVVCTSLEALLHGYCLTLFVCAVNKYEVSFPSMWDAHTFSWMVTMWKLTFNTVILLNSWGSLQTVGSYVYWCMEHETSNLFDMFQCCNLVYNKISTQCKKKKIDSIWWEVAPDSLWD